MGFDRVSMGAYVALGGALGQHGCSSRWMFLARCLWNSRVPALGLAACRCTRHLHRLALPAFPSPPLPHPASPAAAYSPRPGTPAAIWDNQVADLIKADRLNRLNAVVNRVAEERAQRFAGRNLQVLVEGPNPRDPEQVRVHGLRVRHVGAQ